MYEDIFYSESVKGGGMSDSSILNAISNYRGDHGVE